MPLLRTANVNQCSRLQLHLDRLCSVVYPCDLCVEAREKRRLQRCCFGSHETTVYMMLLVIMCFAAAESVPDRRLPTARGQR